MSFPRLLLTAALLVGATALHAQTTPPAPATAPPASPAPAKPAPAPAPPQVTRMTVAQDGSGDYRTVQEAVNASRDLSQVTVTIFIKNGIYREKLVVPSHKTHVTLLGESSTGVVITFGDYSGDAQKHSTYTSHTVLVQANDFTAENITFENSAGPVGQAVALHVEGDRATFRNCRLLGHQDTLYTAVESSRQYYQNCYIEGTTDFLFGTATVVFEGCELRSKRNSYITAASTTAHQKYGYVLLNCKLTATDDAKKVYLGRPWRPHAKTVFINCELGAHITPAGWDNWRNPENEKTVCYAEYKSTGPGANAQERVKWAHQLTAKEAKKYTLKNIFAGGEGWEPVRK
ncbi:pectin esterase [Hymenobacter sp. BT635]|uniref:Pectinesterase n=1 Tax=Hymenobacter nitidus TaxID=2880929 RepID=A0ABS8AJN3_9BACT|nr:pectinesterase family protein [Hymenobacter nitidus]MCB2379887.1 pectin esterase [Hymenobacter nitidus]